jgi:hypothetical protein
MVRVERLPYCLSLARSLFNKSNLRMVRHVIKKPIYVYVAHFLAKVDMFLRAKRCVLVNTAKEDNTMLGELALHFFETCSANTGQTYTRYLDSTIVVHAPLGCRRHSLFVGARSWPVLGNAVVSGTRKWHAIEKVRWLDRHYKEEEEEEEEGKRKSNNSSRREFIIFIIIIIIPTTILVTTEEE